jgi:hypothetical protein
MQVRPTPGSWIGKRKFECRFEFGYREMKDPGHETDGKISEGLQANARRNFDYWGSASEKDIRR